MNFYIFVSAAIVIAVNTIAIQSPWEDVCRSVDCGEFDPDLPKICPNGKPPTIPPDECCPRCPPDCKLVNCKKTPKVCPDGEAPVIPPFSCCPVCLIKSKQCPLCEAFGRFGQFGGPKICPNGKPPVTAVDGCCRVCPAVDCSKIKCCTPTKFCKKGQVPRPTDSTCCPICILNCENVSCIGCGYDAMSFTSPNSCCPVCEQIFY